MKKLVIVFASVLLFASCTQTKIGYVDVEELMKEYNATKSIEAALKLEQEKISKSLDSVSLSFDTRYKEFQKRAPRMSKSKAQKANDEFGQEYQQIEQAKQQAGQYLQQKSNEGIGALTKTIDSVVANYATTNKYNMILGTQGNGTIMYGDDALNLTETIIDVLNTSYDEKK